MGLGPAVCESCLLFADYHSNKEYPNKQGEWLCPGCGFDCTGHFFLYKKDKQTEIEIRTNIVKENKGQWFPDK